MDKVIPIIVVCGIGIAAAIAYIVFVIVRAFSSRRDGACRPLNEFEIDEDTLIIKLGKHRKGK